MARHLAAYMHNLYIGRSSASRATTISPYAVKPMIIAGCKSYLDTEKKQRKMSSAGTTTGAHHNRHKRSSAMFMFFPHASSYPRSAPSCNTLIAAHFGHLTFVPAAGTSWRNKADSLVRCRGSTEG